MSCCCPRIELLLEEEEEQECPHVRKVRLCTRETRIRYSGGVGRDSVGPVCACVCVCRG